VTVPVVGADEQPPVRIGRPVLVDVGAEDLDELGVDGHATDLPVGPVLEGDPFPDLAGVGPAAAGSGSSISEPNLPPVFGLGGESEVIVAAAVSAATPPTFLFSTSGDTLVPIRNSLAFLAALAEHDVPFESHIYLLGPHGISLAKPLTANGVAAFVDAAAAQWLADSVRFLQAVFGNFDTTGEAETYQTLVDRRRFGLTAPIGRLLAEPVAVAIIDRHAPQLRAWVEENPLATGMGLSEIAKTQPELLPAETLPVLGDALADLNVG